jgi:C4-dicarboxylate-specific signal transduction histidine kinase
MDTQLAADLLRIQCDRVRVQQVMLNLIVNGIHSMNGVKDGNRELHISTVSSRREHASRCKIPAMGAPGEPAALFDPFYTTKAGRHGHGPLDLPLDYWWAAACDRARAAWCSLSVYDPR